MDDAETQVDELTPLMDSIKKEAGDAVLAHMEERLAAHRLHLPPLSLCGPDLQLLETVVGTCHGLSIYSIKHSRAALISAPLWNFCLNHLQVVSIFRFTWIRTF